ncbi:YciI family protein [Pedobacter aquatilis]|uniref:YciI family protein n=1 Tax=Pedobacter aquatilis TaxID=351343 RepID=UPI00292DA835|nr:YciI family protein [Pedobacter aquatilis]
MNQYLITAMDYTHPEAPGNRARVRPAHLENMRQYKDDGNLISAGAILDEQGGMIGSALIMQFETREALDDYLHNDPYILEKVWEKVDIKPFKVAIL